MSNESMANYITDTPSEIAELLALNQKLQEQNKIFKEALEKISTDTVEVGFYVEPTWSAQIAREALKKVGVNYERIEK